MTWLRVSLPYATFAMAVAADGVVAEAPPIARWAVGKPAGEVCRLLAARGGKIEELP